MIDFHSHILPNVDDGANSLAQSLAMLRQSFLQGVDLMVSTPHFYANQEYPKAFLQRRNRAFHQLQNAMLMSTEVYPRVALGAEVLYFPGIGESEEVKDFMFGRAKCILIEPPMAPWSDEMLNEITSLRDHFQCTPVIAHVDRYMLYLQDPSLIKRIRERDLLVQVNADFFLNPNTAKIAGKHLKKGNIQLIGSDCHNQSSRPPNLELARKQAKALGVETEFRQLRYNAAKLLLKG